MEEPIFKKGQEILSESGHEGDNIFNLNYWTKKVMEWSMEDAAFKTDLFRFVDALPVLQSHQQVSKHLQEYFCKPASHLPKFAQNTLRALSKFDLSSSLVAKAVKANAAQMAKVFITGSNPSEALPVLKKLREQNLTFTADLLGEASLSEAETIIQQKRYLTLIDELNQEVKTWPIVKLLDTDHAGPIPKVNVSVKLSSLYSQINLLDFENTVEILKDKLRPILRAARDNRTFVNFDMEQFALKDLTYKVFTSILEETEFKGYFDVGIVVQAYLKSAEEDLLKLINWCKSENRHITIRLVKGAYWDYEVINAKQQGWPIPVFTEKTHTDANYEKLSKILLDNYEYTRAAIGSHNVRSLAHALVYAEQINLPQKLLEVQMLYGMAEPIKKTLVKMGYRCRDYAPIGELIPGMAYLVRRLLENTSNESFLRLKFASNLPINDLLKAPTEESQQTNNKLEKKEFSEFENIPLLDFGLQENRIAYQKALQKAEAELGQKLPLFINGEKVWTDSLIESVNPCKPQQVIVQSSSAGKQDTEKAIEIAHKALNSWRKTSISERANVLFKAAKILRERRFELSAWETLELAKTWKEADADIVEAADFCEYYATESLKLSKGKAL
jgi:RHH-type proline utilization regulon transcriptional repressor/proline dehydrogenase/delta 1-pyrroline-5-carboxylate dehydrogenase